MGNFDRRNSMKMKRRKSQAKLKARIAKKRNPSAKKVAVKKTTKKKAT